jgi:dephospho-CoA kinase
MLRVGLTGGLASGKTTVSRELERLGCFVIHADELGHQVLEPGGPAYDEVIREFGDTILLPNGQINRRQLASEVFDHPERLALLNQIVHPHVIEIEEEQLAEHARRDPHGIAIVEAAILIETGSYRRFDKLVVVFCRPEQQLERAIERGFTRAEALSRLSRQMPLEEKRKFADFVIDTSGTKEDTLVSTRAVWEQLQAIRT